MIEEIVMGIKAVFLRASVEHFFGLVVAGALLWLLWWILNVFSERLGQMSDQLAIHGSLLVGMQIQMLADKPADVQTLKLQLEEIQKKLIPKERQP